MTHFSSLGRHHLPLFWWEKIGAPRRESGREGGDETDDNAANVKLNAGGRWGSFTDKLASSNGIKGKEKEYKAQVFE